MIKLVSSKNYNYLRDKVELLHKENFNLSKRNDLLSNSFSIRRAVVGRIASGKTTFIKKKILTRIGNFFLFDICDEYSGIPEGMTFKPGLPINRINIDELKRVALDNKDKFLIIECCELLKTTSNYLNFLSQVPNYILVFQSIGSIPISIYSDLDTIYCLDPMINVPLGPYMEIPANELLNKVVYIR